MKKNILLKAAMLATALGAAAGVNSPGTDGCLQRGRLMVAEGNWQGCIDQLRTIDRSTLQAPQAEQMAWLMALATYNGGFEGAADALRAFIETYPASIHRYEAMLYLANSLLGSDVPEALGIYDSLTDVNPGSALAPDLYYHHAYALMRMGEFEEARPIFTSVESDQEYGPDARFYLGYIAYCDRDFDTALRYFSRTDTSRLPGASSRYYLAQIYYMQGNYEKAYTMAKALIDNPVQVDEEFTAEAYRIAGESLFNRGDRSRAVSYLEHYAAVAASPELSALYILGTTCYENGDYEKAVRYLTPVTASDSAMGQSAFLFIGEAFMNLGDNDAALMAFDNALRGEHDEQVREAAYYNYAVAKFGGGSLPFGSSVATFEDFLRRYPSGPYTSAVQEYLVAGYLTDRDYATALESINRMHNPGEKVLRAKQQILYALGSRALAAGDSPAACDYLRMAEELERYDHNVAAQVNLALGEALYKVGDYRAAADCIERYIAAAAHSDPNRPLGFYDLGYARFASKDYKAAATAFDKFVKTPGNYPPEIVADAYNRLGDASLYDGDFDKAAYQYAQSRSVAPAVADYPLFQMAVIEGYRRNYPAKVDMVDRLLADFPTSALVPDALLEKSEAYIQLNQKDRAIETYRRLVAGYPATAQGRSGYVQMAMTLLGNGDRDEAIKAYRDVIALYPTSDEAMVAVEELQRLAAQDGTLGEFAAFLESIENAPQLDITAADRLTFEAAEEDYITDGATRRLESYINDYPTGAYRAQAWGYLMESAVNRANTGDALTFASLILENYPDTRLAEQAIAVKAASEHSLGQGAAALASWQLLARKASTPAMQNMARAGIMRVARDIPDHDLVIESADALLTSSTAGAEDRNEAVFSRSMALDLKGDTDAARDGWESIAALTDDINGVKSAFYLAQSYYDAKDYAAAQHRLETLIDSSTPHTYWLARAFILLSDIFATSGKTFEAREYLRSLRENYPGSESDIFQMIDSRLSKLK